MLSVRHAIGGVATLLAVAVLVPTVASAKVVVESSTSFHASHASLISGWWWLRTTNASATWQFSADGVKNARVGTVYLQFAPLVTNHVNGGSGYSRSIKVTITGTSIVPAHVHSTTTSVSLVNPFRPKVDEDTAGVGYQTYGYASVSSSIWRPSPLPPRAPTAYNPKSITVTIRWTPGYHVAVNSGAVHLAYARS